MSTRKNRTLALLTAIVLSTSIFAGCSAKTPSLDSNSNTPKDPVSNVGYELDENTPAWKLDKRETKVPFKWYFNADWFKVKFGSDIITQKISDELMVDIEFLAGDDTKLNTYFASGSLPDLISTWNNDEKAPNWALPLEELADQYDPNFYQVTDSDVLNWFRQKDGKIYCYPAFANTQSDYDNGLVGGSDALMVKSSVYETAKSCDFTTPDGFLAGLEKIKQAAPDLLTFGFQSPGANGLTGSFGELLQNYIGVPTVTEDGKYYNRNLDEEYLTWVKTINQAFRNGYIKEGNFTDDDTILGERVTNGDYATLFLGGTVHFPFANFEANHPGEMYNTLDGPKSSSGRERGLTNTGLSGWTKTYITNKCVDPQKAIQLFTYFLSDLGLTRSYYGIEGETFDVTEDDKYDFTDEVKNLLIENPDKHFELYPVGQVCCLFGRDAFPNKYGINREVKSVTEAIDWCADKMTPQYEVENIKPVDGSAEARIYTNAASAWATALSKMIIAKTDADYDAALAEYKKFLDGNNWASVETVMNAKIAENITKLKK